MVHAPPFAVVVHTRRTTSVRRNMAPTLAFEVAAALRGVTPAAGNTTGADAELLLVASSGEAAGCS